MSPQANRSSHPLLSCTDGIAASMSDILLLIARLLVAAVFLMTVWTGGPAAAYLQSINFIAPDVMSPLAHIVEWIIVVTLVLGIATRYGALLAFAFVVIALLTSHLYWQFPAAAQGLQEEAARLPDFRVDDELLVARLQQADLLCDPLVLGARPRPILVGTSKPSCPTR